MADDAGSRTVRLPSLTTEMESAELLDWLVEQGDEVREGDALAEVTTDKVDMELESPYSGTVEELLADVGDQLEIGAAMVTIVTTQGDDLLGGLGLDEEDDGDEDDRDEGVSSAPPPHEADDGRATDGDGAWGDEDSSAEERSAGIVPAPPAVRARARELGVDLADVERTGSRGQVTPDDLRRWEEQTSHEPEAERAEEPEPARAEEPEPAREPESPRPDRDRRKRRSLRAATARSTTRSQAIPQFTLFRTADVTERDARRGGISWTTLVAQALAATLWRHRELNATWDEEAEERAARDDVRIGLAVDTPSGLVVVTLEDPDRISAETADERLREAAARARDGVLRPEDMQPASSTVSNLGGFAVERFTALLVPPQASILSVGAVGHRPAVVDGRVRPRLKVDLGLTIDHRVADGADGARALDTLVGILEDA